MDLLTSHIMRTRVIWDNGEVRIWRSSGRGVACLATGQAEDSQALVAFLQSHSGLLSGSRLTLLLDHPLLDHRLERIPQMSKKLQRQLLEQREQKAYGRLFQAITLGCLIKRLKRNAAKLQALPRRPSAKRVS